MVIQSRSGVTTGSPQFNEKSEGLFIFHVRDTECDYVHLLDQFYFER